jgi:hypothetical protein
MLAQMVRDFWVSTMHSFSYYHLLIMQAVLTLKQQTTAEGGQTLTLVGSAKMDVKLEPVGHSWVTATLDINATAVV